MNSCKVYEFLKKKVQFSQPYFPEIAEETTD